MFGISEIKEDIADIKEAIGFHKRTGIILDYIHWGESKKIKTLEEKINLLLSHLSLVYIPAEKAESKLVKKEKVCN